MKLQTRQTSALAYVEAEGTVTAGKLAKYLNTKKGNAAQRLYGLRKKGLVESSGMGQYRITPAGIAALGGKDLRDAEDAKEFNAKRPTWYEPVPKSVAAPKPEDETMTVKKSDIEYLKREIKRWQDAYMELALTVAGGKRDTEAHS